MYKSVKTDLNTIVVKLEALDAERKLYTLSKSKSKDSVTYPTFKAKEAEDVHRFVKEFKEALITNQVAEKDQVKTLRSNLRNFALDIVHKEVKKIDKAYDLLIKQFGNSDQIWAAKFKVFEAECQKKWPSQQENPKERYQKLSKMLEQFEELHSLVKNGSVDSGELYNHTSVKKLYSLIPSEMKTEALKKLTCDSKSSEKVDALKDALIMFRDLSQQEMLLKFDGSAIENKNDNKNYYGDQADKKGQGARSCFFCKKDWTEQTHIKQWSIFCCIKFLRLDLEHRRKELKERGLCYCCGFKMWVKGQRHNCVKFKEIKGSDEIRCIAPGKNGQCFYNGLTCNHKEINPEVKEKVRRILKIELKIAFVFTEPIRGKMEHVEETIPQEAFGSLQDRSSDLQNGEVAKHMGDEELHKFFRERERLVGGDVEKILGVPEGETLFIFCVIKGRTRPLRAFMDNGCSSWLVKNGVPENELKSAKLRDGPIPMWVAGGHTVYASAEWASLLPLNNGFHQIVKGL